MKNKKEENFKNSLFKESLSGIKSDIRLTLMLLSFFLFLSLFIRFILNIPLSTIVFIVLFAWLLFYSSHNYFVRRKKTRKELCDFHFRNTIIDILLLTVVIHYLGGVEWIGAIFYIAVLAWTSNILSKKQSLSLALFALCFYSVLVFLEYFQFLPHRETFGPSIGLYKDPVYLGIHLLVLATVFFFIAQNYGNSSEAFRIKQEELVNAQEEIEEAKDILEIKVKARTKELEELTKSLDAQVKQRTKEIEEKMKELEKFHKMAVGRELKMVELKKEIKELKEKLKC